MIVAHLTDGLGNQLFQYAAARRLSLHRRTPLKLDTYWYRRRYLRRFGLSQFNIDATSAGLADVARLCPSEALSRVVADPLPGRFGHRTKRILERIGLQSPYRNRLAISSDKIPLMVGRVASERIHHFDPAVLELPDNVALSGYWQSEKYFADVEEIIRMDLTWREPPTPLVQRLIAEIADSESIALHVRRGDKVMTENHRATTLEDCRRALEFFRERLAHPKFFVFTDDWPWVTENLPSGNDIVHVCHGLADVEDLRLMSTCRHNIVAASSFSWWGAWLNRNPGKLVVRPDQWVNLLNPEFRNYDVSDVFPASWINLETPSANSGTRMDHV